MGGIKINTKEDAFRLFEEAVKSLAGAKLILTQKPISDLLKCLMLNEQLRSFVSECCKGVDYDSEYRSAIRSDGMGGTSLVLPKSNKKIIALITGILSDFDRETLHIASFVRNLYPESDTDLSYKTFCDNVLWAYHRAFRQSFLYDIDAADGVVDQENSVTINQTTLEQAAGLLAPLRDVFIGDNKLPAERRKDLLALTDGLYYSMEKGDKHEIKMIWTGLKLALIGYKKAEKKFSDITDLLILYALLG